MGGMRVRCVGMMVGGVICRVDDEVVGGGLWVLVWSLGVVLWENRVG